MIFEPLGFPQVRFYHIGGRVLHAGSGFRGYFILQMWMDFSPFFISFLRSLSLYTVEALWMHMCFLRGLLGHVTDGCFVVYTTYLLIICWYARG